MGPVRQWSSCYRYGVVLRMLSYMGSFRKLDCARECCMGTGLFVPEKLYRFLMALQQIPDRPDAGLEPSSRALVEKLDELLVDCTPKEIDDPIHGIE